MSLVFNTFYNEVHGEFLCLVCFINSKLNDKCYIPVTYLEQCLRYGHIKGKVSILTDPDYKKVQHKYSLQGLLAECEEVREFARLYYPEHVI